MGLREQAEADLRSAVEDEGGFGWPLTVTSPDGHSAQLVGLTTDIGVTIDPETLQPVARRRASCTLSFGSLAAAGFDSLPTNVANESSKPWLVEFYDTRLQQLQKYKVIDSLPDRTLGCVVCTLEFFK